MKRKILDCLIIGAGPAGISAALYLHRFRRNILIVDSGNSRMLKIPKSHNYPAFKEGISGPDLLNKLKEQLLFYNIPIHSDNIITLDKTKNDNFISNQYFKSKTVILATGIQDIEIKLPQIKKFDLRFCPICDAYEVINKEIAIVGNDSHSVSEALFLRRYSESITLLTQGNTLTMKDLKIIQTAKIKVITDAIIDLDYIGSKIRIHFSNHNKAIFDTLYSALGCTKNSNLALRLGAKHKEGELIVNASQQTSIPKLYAAGDIVSGLNQICVAQSQGAIAASAINQLL